MDNVQPLVSIIMPAYNAEATLEESIKSVLAQTLQDWELIIAVDAATDGTLAIALGWQNKDSRIRVIFEEVNQGVAGIRNLAMAQASGKYIAFLDSDDLWLPEKLSMQLSFMSESGARVCYSAYRRFDKQGPLNIVMPPDRVDYPRLLRGNVIGNLTGVVERSLVDGIWFERVGHEDYLFWLKVLARSGVAYRVPGNAPIAEYRVAENSLSANKVRNMRWQWHIYRKELELPLAQSLYFMASYVILAFYKRAGLRSLFFSVKPGGK